MKQINIKILKVEIPYAVPASVEEFDKIGKKPVVGTCLDEGTKNVLYRGTFSDVRDIALHGQDEVKDESGKVVTPKFVGLEESSKIARKTKLIKVKSEKGDKEVEEYDETEQAYFERVAATQKKELKDYAPLFLAASLLVPFDPSKAEAKQKGPKKLAEKFKTVATEFLSGKKNLEKLNAALSKTINKTFTKSGDVAKDTETLGWLCKEFHDAQDAFSKMA